MDQDEALVRRAAEGEEAAFELLVRRHQEPAWRFALSLLGPALDAEEAVQETFLRAYRGLGSFRGEASFRTWLFAICRRVCADLRARQENVVPLDRASRVGAEEEHPEERIVIEQTLGAMPPEERSAFVLVDLLGFTREEAARIEEAPASTLKSRLYRARDRLARALDVEGGMTDEV